MNAFGFILIVVALAFIWFAMMRPQRRRQQEQLQMWESLRVGDEVVTAGGIYGEVTGFEGDDVRVRIAAELEVRVARRAIAGVIASEAEEAEEAVDDVEGAGEEPQDGDAHATVGQASDDENRSYPGDPR